MKKGLTIILVIVSLWATAAQAALPKGDVFKGKLFAPDIILEHRSELGLTKQQFTDIRAVVVEVQTGIAEHEWDMREAYQEVMAELDRTPINEADILQYAMAAMLAENKVKAKQLSMLVRLKNLLTAEQIMYLETVVGKQ